MGHHLEHSHQSKQYPKRKKTIYFRKKHNFSPRASKSKVIAHQI